MNEVREFFDRLAEEWDTRPGHSELDPKWFKSLLEEIGITENMRVVDLGCGTGAIIPYLLEKIGEGGVIYAVDISSRMLEKLREKFPHKNIYCYNIPAEEMDAIGASVDAIICHNTFPHVEDKRRCLLSAAKILKKGGAFLISHHGSRDEINRFHIEHGYPISKHLIPEDDEMRRLFLSAGFGDVVISDTPSNYVALARRL